MTMSRLDSTASPLTVKEQFEASANRFWSSVRNLNIEETMKSKNLDQEHSSKTGSSSESQEDNTLNAVSFQSVIHAVFGSCTTGASYEGFQKTRSLSAGSSVSPAKDMKGGNNGENEPPKPRRSMSTTQLRSRAEEAVLHLREQQMLQQQDLQQQQKQHQRQKEYEKILSTRAQPVKPPETEGPQPQQSLTRTNKEHPSFFPVSNPNSGRDPPGACRTSTKTSVPKEVSSPPRRGLAGKSNGIPAVATTYSEGKASPGDDIFDFEDDGVSVITQLTVDEMMRQLEECQKHFPNDFSLNRVYSDDTDPVNQSFGQLKKECAKGEASINELNAFLTEGRYMSPPRLTRQNRSSETRSHFTKTTNSSHTDDFSVWKQEEQQYWKSQVAKDESTETAVDSNPAKDTIIRLNTSHSAASSRQMTPPSLRARKLQKVREKVKRNVVRLNAAAANGELKALPQTNDDIFMDALILQNVADVAEI